MPTSAPVRPVGPPTMERSAPPPANPRRDTLRAELRRVLATIGPTPGNARAGSGHPSDGTVRDAVEPAVELDPERDATDAS